MKVLADDDLAALLSVVGVRGGAQRVNVELAGSAVTADLVACTADGLVHVEFVKDPAPDLDLRMVDYRLRLRRRHREVPIIQYVLVLRDIDVPERYVDPDPGQLGCAWSVVRLGELDPSVLLGGPTTAALAALGRGDAGQRAAALAGAARVITARADSDRARVLLAAAVTLASIVLPGRIIDQALKEATMPVLVRDTPLGREIYEEGRHEGREEGRREGLRVTAGLMLRRIFGDDPRIDSIAERLAALPEQDCLTRLATATSLDDLTD